MDDVKSFDIFSYPLRKSQEKSLTVGAYTFLPGTIFKSRVTNWNASPMLSKIIGISGDKIEMIHSSEKIHVYFATDIARALDSHEIVADRTNERVARFTSV